MTSVNSCTALMVVPRTDAPTYKALAAQGGTSSAKAIAPVVNDTVEINGVAKKLKGAKLKKAGAIISGTATKAGEAIKENIGKVVTLAKGHKVAAAAIGVAATALAAVGIYKGVQAHNNKVQAHQA